MSDDLQENRVEVLLKGERVRATGPLGAGPKPPPFSESGRGRWFAFALLGLLYMLMISVCMESFEPRVEWVDSGGKTMLEDRPVFWPLILFGMVGRMLSGLAAWFPSFTDPTRGVFKVPDSPPLRQRRLLFRVLYGGGLVMAVITLFNNLAFSDILGVVKAVVIAVLILAGITLLFRMALISFLSRLSVQIQRRR